jgi:hypothetical protein
METTDQKEHITLDKLNKMILEIEAEYQGTPFLIFTGEHEGSLWVQVGTLRPDTYTKKMETGKGGKAYVSPHATEDEVVKKIFGLCHAYVEHEMREGFKWKGRRIFNPHLDLNALWSVALKSNYRRD